MSALELITVRATNPSTGGAGIAVTGNSLTIRDTRKDVRLLGLWQTRTGEGNTQLVSPLMHDNLVGYQLRGEAGLTIGLTAATTPVYAQDTLTCTLIGSAAAEEHSSWLLHYDDLPGISANLIDASEFDARALDITCVLNTVTPGTTAYGTAVAINATDDQLKANTEYALIGATFEDGVATVGTHAVRYVSSDFGNLGVGMPASAIVPANLTHQWFLDLAMQTGLKVIPVFNAANKALTNVAAIGAAATGTGVCTILVRLKDRKR